MFNQLMKQVSALTVDTEERLKGVIDLVFEKAIDEPSFSVAYANMCRCLVTVRREEGVKPEISKRYILPSLHILPRSVIVAMKRGEYIFSTLKYSQIKRIVPS